jgi:hypothetical protein
VCPKSSDGLPVTVWRRVGCFAAQSARPDARRASVLWLLGGLLGARWAARDPWAETACLLVSYSTLACFVLVDLFRRLWCEGAIARASFDCQELLHQFSEPAAVCHTNATTNALKRRHGDAADRLRPLSSS